MRLIIELTKYMMILMLGVYTYHSFNILRHRNKEAQDRHYRWMDILIFAFHFIGSFSLYLQVNQERFLYLYFGEVILFIFLLLLYQRLYPGLSKLLLRNMMMLLAIGFIVQTRLSYDRAVRQAAIAAVVSLLCLVVPMAISKFTWLRKSGWIYGVASILLLMIVLVAGVTKHGATNWLDIRGFRFQPSEIVKILYVFCIASLFEEGTQFRKVLTATVLAGAVVLILVFQRDLGGALIFFVTYILLLYGASAKPLYLIGGLAGGSIAAYMAYRIFYHVKVRVMAWSNPFQYIDNEGYQITQSLFAIGTGGWFGLGLGQGLPRSIPVVDSDFVFSAIAEELGGFFSLLLILIYLVCFLQMVNMALNIKEVFYRLISLGFGIMMGFQVFLSIGGVTKFIPSTGVTLPLISSGGSSILATILMFMILQGIYVRENSVSRHGEKQQ